MAGHSKWANIKHKKAKEDAKRGKVFTRLIRELTIAARHGGSDPGSNPRLRLAITKAQAENMSKDTMDRAIKRGAGELGGAQMEEIRYEGYGPGGVAVMVDCLTDNKNRTAANVRAAFSKGGGNVGTPGCVSFMFDRKGQIIIDKEECDMDPDELMMFALDAGAEDFADNEDSYEVLTDPEQFSAVREAFEQKGIPMLEADVKMIPQNWVSLKSEEDQKKMQRILDLLDEDDDVQAVFHSWDEE